MPKILSRQPRWLDHASPGYNFFQPNDKAKHSPTGELRPEGPSRAIAHRGTELFLAVGNELRWSDVGVLKGAEDSGQRGRGSLFDSTNRNDEKQQKYLVLKTPVARTIQQLSVSPSGDFIAILTSHTCHVCVLPSRRHLDLRSLDPIRLPSFQVGPTAHVLEQAPLISVLWHPLAPTGNGLITITKDACVRLWELDSKNRSTFDEPALAVDLKKLANATSVREDFTASRYGVNKGFSPDDVEMQVAAACFGGKGNEDEDGWSSMTLWVAMSEGDVYALCPFLPSRFAASSTLLPSLSTSVVARTRIFHQDQFVSESEKRVADQQCKWLAELDAQEPLAVSRPGGIIEIFARPERPGAIPKLQGPFQLMPEPDFGEITDIHVIAPKINDDELFDEGQDDTLDLSEGLSIGVVCLATNTSKVHICLNTEGVEAEWLPAKRSRSHLLDDHLEERELLLFETVDLARGDKGASEDWWPTFTASPVDRYEVFTTQATGVYSMSLRPWIDGLENELAAPQLDTEGVGFRLNVILDSASTVVNTVTSEFSEPLRGVHAAVAILDNLDSEIGFIVLTSAMHIPFAAILDLPFNINPFAPDNAIAAGVLPLPEPRTPYQPPTAFTATTTIPSQFDALGHAQPNTTPAAASASALLDLKRPLTFTTGTLQKITDAHRLLSTETHRLGLAAADLFRQCERMVSELRAEVQRARALAHRVDVVTGENEFPDPAPADAPPLVRGGRAKIADRVAASRHNTTVLLERVERLRKKVRAVSGAPLSRRELAFAAEVEKLARGLGVVDEEGAREVKEDAEEGEGAAFVRMSDSGFTASTISGYSLDGQGEDGGAPSLAARYEDVRGLYATLRAQAEEAVARFEAEKAQKGDEAVDGQAATGGGGGDASAWASASQGDYRRHAMAKVYELLERETAMLDAVGERLDRLRVGGGR